MVVTTVSGLGGSVGGCFHGKAGKQDGGSAPFCKKYGDRRENRSHVSQRFHVVSTQFPRKTLAEALFVPYVFHMPSTGVVQVFRIDFKAIHQGAHSLVFMG